MQRDESGQAAGASQPPARREPATALHWRWGKPAACTPLRARAAEARGRAGAYWGGAERRPASASSGCRGGRRTRGAARFDSRFDRRRSRSSKFVVTAVRPPTTPLPHPCNEPCRRRPPAGARWVGHPLAICHRSYGQGPPHAGALPLAKLWQSSRGSSRGNIWA